MVATYVRPPPMMVKGQGCYIWDIENRRYLDFTAGIAVNALGHCDPAISQIIASQAKTLMHTSNLYHNPWTGSLCKLLVEATLQSGGMATAAKAFISNSGTEANEAAIKFAKKHAKAAYPNHKHKFEMLSFHNAFHGRTMGALSATPNPKYQAPFSPLLPGFNSIPYGIAPDELATHVTENTAGVIIEPIQGEGGVNTASPAFLTALRHRCNEVGAVLIYDEIQCGLSRTGTLWAHSSLPTAAHPDIITTAKALGNGFPIGGTIVSEDVARAVVTGDHGTTFGGNPLGSRVAHHIVERLADPALQSAVLEKERLFRTGFARLRQRFPDVVTQVRGRGLLLGLQLSRDPTPVITAARERGLLIISCGRDTLRFVPPLVISSEEIEEGLAILESAMEAVFMRGETVEGTRGQQEMAPPGR